MSEIIKNDAIIIRPGQNLVASFVNSFKFELHSLLKDLPKEITIDLTGVDIVDSLGMGIIIAAHNSLNQIGGKLKITNISKNLYDLFVAMRLNRHFTLEVAVD